MSREPDDVIDCMARMKGDGQPFAVATVVHVSGGAPAREGSKAVVRGDGRVIGWIGGGCTLGAVKKTASRALSDGRARLIRVRPNDGAVTEIDGEKRTEDFDNHCATGGTVEIFVEPVLPRPSLIVVGASQVAQALCDLGMRVGYAVTVVAMPGRSGSVFELRPPDRRLRSGTGYPASLEFRRRRLAGEVGPRSASFRRRHGIGLCRPCREPQEGRAAQAGSARRRVGPGSRRANPLARRGRHRGGDARRNRVIDPLGHRQGTEVWPPRSANRSRSRVGGRPCEASPRPRRCRWSRGPIIEFRNRVARPHAARISAP